MDTAPVGLTADPMSLNQIASGALFVVRYDTASMHEIKEALERIEKSGISILGCVVNGVQVSEKGIKNPVREKEKIKKAEAKAQNETEPFANLNQEYSENQEGFSVSGDDSNIKSLVAGFAGESGAEMQGDTPQVTTSDSFVDLLFQAEDNTKAADEEKDTDQEQ